MSELDDIIKKVGKGKEFNLVPLSDESSPCVVRDWMSTGCMALDRIIGGGLPLGRITEVYGDSSTGKSLIASQAVTEAQANGDLVLYMDTERAVSIPMMEAVGVDPSKLIYADPDTIEEVFQLMQEVLEAKKPESRLLIVWDSIAATTAKDEQSADYGKAMMGKHAQLLSQGLRKFNGLISKHNACALFLNQTRMKIGVMFGDNEATFGGKAVEFYASVRIRLKKGKKIKNGDEVIGIHTRAQIVKNKVAMPFREAAIPIYFNVGIADDVATFEYLKEQGMLEQSGAWYTLKYKGKEITKKFQQKNWPGVFDQHYDALWEIMHDEDTDDI